ncbi:hypothetical protein ACSBR2_021381 [Camellia fascicularis]
MVFPESYGRMWQWAESENLKELLLLAYWEKVHLMLPIPFLLAMILLYYDNVVNWLIFIQSNGLCFPPFFSKSCDKVGWFEICICVYAGIILKLDYNDGIARPSWFGSASTAEQVTQGIDATILTAIVTAI